MPKAKERATKNSWMENPKLLSAAVRAVQEGYPLRWSRSYHWGFSNTWDDYKRAAAWVSRELKKRNSRPIAVGALHPRIQSVPSSRAATTLLESDAAKIAEKAEEDRRRTELLNQQKARTGPYSFQARVTEFVKTLGLQIIYLLAIIPLAVLFGTTPRTGVLTQILVPILLGLGILILILRFVYALAKAVMTGKPIAKDWYK